jgi:large subunit ribosomal protein L17
MRHLKKGRKFGRKTGQRKAFVKSLASNLILKEKIRTTEARAKTLKSEVEKMVTLAKKENVASLRLLIARVSKKPAMKLYYDIAPRYKERAGGYLRVTKISAQRQNDAARMAYIEFV